MLAPPKKLLAQAIEKAAGAYGESVERDLDKAITRLRRQPARLDACMTALKMTAVPQALLWKRIRALAPKR
jgi:hypothetical protein